jgi:hypothetical protein
MWYDPYMILKDTKGPSTLLILAGLLGIGSFSSCTNTPDRPTVENSLGHRYEVIEVDGCEYLLGIQKLTHKGNCTNPIHCHNR